ncbi:GyrI-like domain-containing protein [Dyella flava]|uniref:AraC family transcriptional regulator n=1 Tax=Dyella flava TaxID=1920170 RepID=A0ABS2K8X3_9GAMM|nr:GyrI-like domain-containing protein [Dyella flava]MBM7127288.1 AraC family transcriptional regulator [Dyella flava]
MKVHTEQDYRRRIARVVETILLDPAAPHTVESLAAVAHLSAFHFHRIYRAFTGENIATTVKRVRLARAAYRLADAKDTVTSIALGAGYDSAQTFARAFRSFTGITPSEFSERQRDLATLQADPDNEALPVVELREVPPMHALCLRHGGPLPSITHTFCALYRALGDTPHQAAIGIGYGDPEEKDGFRYFAGVTVQDAPRAIAPVEAMHVEGGLYASYRLVGPYALIAPTFQTLFGRWLPQSGYEPDHRPALELYHTHASAGSPSENVTELLIPIRRE